MGAYQLVAVGTDGSDSSFRAVDRAATVAAVGYGLNFTFLAIERRLLRWRAAHHTHTPA